MVDNGLDHFHDELNSAGKVDTASVLFYPNGRVNEALAVTNTLRYIYPADPDNQVSYTGITAYPEWEDCPNQAVPSLTTNPTCYFRTRDRTGAVIEDFFRIPFERETDHGLGVATLAVGGKSQTPRGTDDIQGVAYDAKIRFMIGHFGRGLNGKGVDPAVLIDGQLELLRPLIDAGDIPVINLSWGVPLTRADDPTLRSGSFGSIRGPFLGQTGVSAANKTILVWAAGNSNHDACHITRTYGCARDPTFNENEKRQALINQGRTLESFGAGTTLDDIGRFDAAYPNRPSGLSYALQDLRGHNLAVVAVDRDGTSMQAGSISDFSNLCGELPRGWLASQGRHYCLAAPGRVPIPRYGTTNRHLIYPTVGGTSLAAPHVAGAVAVLIEFFTNDKGTVRTDDDERNVGNTAIAQRIIETANRRGTYARGCVTTRLTVRVGGVDVLECPTYSRIYGAGLLDLKAATEPVGTAVIVTSGNLNGAALPFSGTRLFSGPAYGDAFSRAFAGTHIAAFDSMLFPFWHPLTSLVDSPSRRTLHYHRARFSPPSRIATHLPGVGTFHLGVKTLPPIPRRAFRRPDATDPARRRPSSLSFRRETASGSVFAAWRSPGSTPLSLRETLPTPLSSEAFTHPFMSLADNGISVGVRAGALTAAAFTDPDAPSPVHGMALDYALSPYISAQAGMVSEKGGALGLRPAGAFGGLSTTSTAFTGLKLDAPVSPRWRVLSHAHFGTARPDVSGIGLVKEVSPLLVSAVSVGIAGRGVLTDGDSLTLAVSQPLRVERGRVSLVVPTGRTPDGDLRRVGVDAGLEPSGREVTLSAAWTAPVGDAAYVRLAAGASREPGHDAAADNDFHALADVSFRF